MGFGPLVLAMVMPPGSSDYLALIFSLLLRGWEADPAGVRSARRLSDVRHRMTSDLSSRLRQLVQFLFDFCADVRLQAVHLPTINPIQAEPAGATKRERVMSWNTLASSLV